MRIAVIDGIVGRSVETPEVMAVNEVRPEVRLAIAAIVERTIATAAAEYWRAAETATAMNDTATAMDDRTAEATAAAATMNNGAAEASTTSTATVESTAAAESSAATAMAAATSTAMTANLNHGAVGHGFR